MDQNNGLEAKISQGEIRILLTIDLEEQLLPTRIYLQDQTLHIGIIIRTIESPMINTKISHSAETMEMDLKTNLSAIRMGTGDTMEFFLVPRQLKEETSGKITPIANQEVINITTQLSSDPTTDLQLVFHLTNTTSHKAIIRHHLMSFASPPLTIPLMNYQIFAR